MIQLYKSQISNLNILTMHRKLTQVHNLHNYIYVVIQPVKVTFKNSTIYYH